MIRTPFALTALSLACIVLPAQAAIVNHADVGGFRTFLDTSTGLIWADLDNARLAIERIARAPELSPQQRQAATQQWLDQHFQGTEKLRASALLGL